MYNLKGKGSITLILTLLFGFSFLISSAKAVTSVSSCQNITSPGDYQLTGNLTGSPCLELRADGISIDFNNYYVTQGSPLINNYGDGNSIFNGGLGYIGGSNPDGLFGGNKSFSIDDMNVYVLTAGQQYQTAYFSIYGGMNITHTSIDMSGYHCYGVNDGNNYLDYVTMTGCEFEVYSGSGGNVIRHSIFDAQVLFTQGSNNNYICNSTIFNYQNSGSNNVRDTACLGDDDQSALYTVFVNSSFCTASSITQGNPVSCVTPSFIMPDDCQNMTVTVSEFDTTSFCFGQFKSNYLANPGYPSDHGLQQILYADCGQSPHNSTLTNTYLTHSDTMNGNCTLQPYSNQTGSLICTTTASCNIPNPIIDFLFPSPSYFDTVYGTDVALVNAIINNGISCLDVTLTGSNSNFFRLGTGQDVNMVLTQLGGASHLGNTLNFHICPNETDWYFAYFSPSTYGASSLNATYNLTVTASVDGSTATTKRYNTVLSGVFVPIGQCNGNGICDLGESNSFCPADCPNEGQVGTTPCTVGNCTDSEQPVTPISQDPIWDTGNAILNLFLTPNSLMIIISLILSVMTLYYVGKAMPDNQTVPMFAGALLFLVMMGLGVYYQLVINWIGAILVIISGGFAISLVSKIMGIGGK
jgi:hypothetical protein